MSIDRDMVSEMGSALRDQMCRRAAWKDTLQRTNGGPVTISRPELTYRGLRTQQVLKPCHGGTLGGGIC